MLAEKQRQKELSQIFKTVEKKEEKTEEEKKEENDVEKEIEDQIKEEEEMTLEEIIEKERSKILNGTKVTKESFEKWKNFKVKQKKKEEERKRKMEEKLYKKGNTVSGKPISNFKEELCLS
jgi:hypothetical protein